MGLKKIFSALGRRCESQDQEPPPVEYQPPNQGVNMFRRKYQSVIERVDCSLMGINRDPSHPIPNRSSFERLRPALPSHYRSSFDSEVTAIADMRAQRRAQHDARLLQNEAQSAAHASGSDLWFGSPLQDVRPRNPRNSEPRSWYGNANFSQARPNSVDPAVAYHPNAADRALGYEDFMIQWRDRVLQRSRFPSRVARSPAPQPPPDFCPTDRGFGIPVDRIKSTGDRSSVTAGRLVQEWLTPQKALASSSSSSSEEVYYEAPQMSFFDGSEQIDKYVDRGLALELLSRGS